MDSNSELQTQLSSSELALLQVDIEHAEEYEGGLFVQDIARFVELASRDISESDFIMIDGGPRNLIASLVARHSRQKVIVLVDNTDMMYLLNGCAILRSAGFVEIPFEGLGPLNSYQSRTSCFVRDLGALMC